MAAGIAGRASAWNRRGTRSGSSARSTSGSTTGTSIYDPADVSWVWRVTGEQDYVLCENNQLGVNSTRYEPGPYATIERGPDRFIEWYFERMRETT